MGHTNVAQLEQRMCLIEDKEIEIITQNYKRSKAKEGDEEMEQSGQGTGAGWSATHGTDDTSAGADAEGVSKSAAPGRQSAPDTPPNPEEEYQISKDKGKSWTPSTHPSHWRMTTMCVSDVVKVGVPTMSAQLETMIQSRMHSLT